MKKVDGESPKSFYGRVFSYISFIPFKVQGWTQSWSRAWCEISEWVDLSELRLQGLYAANCGSDAFYLMADLMFNSFP